MRLVPKTVDVAISLSQKNHPQIQAALHNVDSAALAVRIAEGQLYPTLNLTGALSQGWDRQLLGQQTSSASIIASLNVPIYEGGAVYALVRQSKEQMGQARLLADLAREQIRAQAVAAWGVWQNVGPLIEAVQSQVRAAEIALNGVREEARVGQRTTLDVLNAQQALAQCARVARHARSANASSARTTCWPPSASSTPTRLGLSVQHYDPTIHFEQVKDKWIGTRTPDGR